MRCLKELRTNLCSLCRNEVNRCAAMAQFITNCVVFIAFISQRDILMYRRSWSVGTIAFHCSGRVAWLCEFQYRSFYAHLINVETSTEAFLDYCNLKEKHFNEVTWHLYSVFRVAFKLPSCFRVLCALKARLCHFNRAVRRHPERRKMRHGIPRGTKN